MKISQEAEQEAYEQARRLERYGFWEGELNITYFVMLGFLWVVGIIILVRDGVMTPMTDFESWLAIVILPIAFATFFTVGYCETGCQSFIGHGTAACCLACCCPQ